MSKLVLILNCGSSSLKFAVMDAETGEDMLSGLAECFNLDDARIKWKLHGVKGDAMLGAGAAHQEALDHIVGHILPQSLQASVWCAVDGLGERVPIQPLDGEARAALLKALDLDKAAAQAPQRFATFSCNRRLTPASRVQVVFGKGVATPSGVLNNVERRFAFTVREPFTASMGCERENAQAACMPIRPITLKFSAPVPRRLVEQMRLRSDTAEHAPVIEDGLEADALLVLAWALRPPSTANIWPVT